MSQNEAIKLLDKYLDGSCTPTERQQVEQWLEGIGRPGEWSSFDDESRKKFIEDLFEDILANSGYKQLPPVRQRRIRPRIYKISAAVLLFLAGWVCFYQYRKHSVSTDQNIIFRYEYTGTGEMKQLKLPDGTLVFLNNNSELKYPAHFLKANRQVYIKGEAYFEVAQNAAKPFIVHSGSLKTKVLGTAFNVNAYPHDKMVQITVITGKIAVGTEDEADRSTRILTKNEQLTFHGSDKKINSPIQVNATEFSSWKSGKLTFYRCPMEEVIRVLHRAYGTNMKLKNPALNSCEITGHFDRNQGLNDVLKAICLSIGGRFENNRDTLIIEGPGCQ